MQLTFVFPEQDHVAIEERYAAMQTEMMLRRDSLTAPLTRWNEKTFRGVIGKTSTRYVCVLTDPLIAPPPGLVGRLLRELEETDADAIVPVSSDPDTPLTQVIPPKLYLTLRQFEDVSAEIADRADDLDITTLLQSAPLFVARTDKLHGAGPPHFLSGLRVAVAKNCYIHRFASQRGQMRQDLLDRVRTDARSILEFGCGEAALGAALKARQECRVVGVELDEEAAKIARTRVDEVISGDVRTLIDRIDEKFDFIVGGDIVEHLDDPWTFLTRLKKVAKPGTQLLLSLPNVANWVVITDLLRGRFDYVYLGILCAGHLRFFTRKSIEEMLQISGWELRNLETQEPYVTDEFHEFRKSLESAGVPISVEDLTSPGWYVLAEIEN